MGRDPVEHAKRGKYKPPAMQVCGDFYGQEGSLSTALDKSIQQVIAQPITNIYEEIFSDYSFDIYLDKFDKELEQRGLRFTRYANDVLTFTKSEMAANHHFFDYVYDCYLHIFSYNKKKRQSFSKITGI